jgi:hypothetical protein
MLSGHQSQIARIITQRAVHGHEDACPLRGHPRLLEEATSNHGKEEA